MEPFLKIDNRKITREAAGIGRLSEVGLYQLLSAFLGNPAFDTCRGGLVPALQRHCKNGYFSFHKNWNRLLEAGYLKRVQLPLGAENRFCTYYELSGEPRFHVKPFRNLTAAEGSAYLRRRTGYCAPDCDYTAVSYRMVMDPALSLAAKGLYALIRRALNLAAHSDHFTMTKQRLLHTCREGRTAFNSAWNELRKTGYLSVEPFYNHDRNRLEYRYRLAQGPSDSPAEPPAQNAIPAAPDAPQTQRSAEPVVPAQRAGGPLQPAGLTTEALEQLRSAVHRQIHADWLEEKRINPPLIRGIIDVMAETYAQTAPTMAIGKQVYATDTVQRRLRGLELGDILQVLDQLQAYLKHTKKKIRSPKKYILSCLFNGQTNADLTAGALIVKDFG